MTQRRIRQILQTSPLHRSNIIRWERSFFGAGTNGHWGGNAKPGKSGETFHQLKIFFQISLLSVFVLHSVGHNFFLRWHINFYANVSFYFLTSFKVFKKWMMMTKKWLESAELCFTQPKGYSKYLSKRFFWWKHVWHQRCHQQAKFFEFAVLSVQMSTARWFSTVQGLWHGMPFLRNVLEAHVFENENFTVESYWSMLISYGFPHFRVLGQHYVFSRAVLLLFIKTELKPFWTTGVQPTGLKGVDQFLGRHALSIWFHATSFCGVLSCPW